MSAQRAHFDCEVVTVHEGAVAYCHLTLDFSTEKLPSDSGSTDLGNSRAVTLSEKAACLTALRRACAGIIRIVAAVAVVLALVEQDSVNEDDAVAVSPHIDLHTGVVAAGACLLCSRTNGSHVFEMVALGEIAVPAAYKRQILLP